MSRPDYCPARLEPRPAGVPSDRQIRAVWEPLSGSWAIAWLGPGGGLNVLRVTDELVARQCGCRCSANPRLLAAELTPRAAGTGAAGATG